MFFFFFFLGGGGGGGESERGTNKSPRTANESERRKTNRVNSKAVLGDSFVPRSD